MAFYNLARAKTSTTGTSNVVEGAAVTGFLTFELAGVPDGAVVSYGLQDLDANGMVTQSEVGIGTWTTATKTLARTTVTKSTNSDNKISLAGAGGAEMYITALAADIIQNVGFATTATAGGTTTLTVSSKMIQQFTGTGNQTVQLPVVSTLVLGYQFFIISSTTSGNRITINSSGGNNLASPLLDGQSALVTCILITGTTAASWKYDLFPAATSVYSGTWTPTLFNITNAAASAVLQDFDYVRVENKIIGGGALSIDPTAAGSTQVDFTIPIASAFTTGYDLNGTGSSGNTTNSSAALIADATNDRCSLVFTAVDTANRNWRIDFVLTLK